METLFNNVRYHKKSKIHWNVNKDIVEAINELSKEIENDDGKLEFLKNCEICDSKEFEKIASYDRYGFPVGTNICTNCGFVFRNPRLSKNSAGWFYNNYYTRIFKGNLTFENYFDNQKKHAEFIWEFFGDHLADVKKVIENGCGPGGIISFLRNKGFDVKGYDLDTSYAAWESTQKPQILSGDINTIIKNENKVDLLILSNVLEHAFNPLEELVKSHQAINDDGYIFIEVPGLRSYIDGHFSLCGCSNRHPYDKDILREFVIAHNYEFDLSTLNYLLNKAGFEVIKGNELIRIIAKKSSRNKVAISNLSENYKRNKDYLLKLEKERLSYQFSISTIKKKIKKIIKKIIYFE